ncbi:DUF2116 family Zn-ribbon domain-containing protein [Methanotorris igneus]|uniref:DUF2116 family Zn-ribbon domain-containing protein n=1 Tax=Methanotorris igneus (strain DSM 5666 / JCM 11834 / Kol 5) TaxID=880724 RepID=F6BAL6_METIK|nr:Protein of unknown function DUF2116, Zn-ribbon [Methanotorris igneus Kol 5]
MIPPHRHCLNCGISIPPEESFCSQKCKEEFIAKRKKMMRSQQIFFIAMLIIIFAYIAMVLFK